MAPVSRNMERALGLSEVLLPCRGASVTQPVESSTAPSSAAHLYIRASARIVNPKEVSGNDVPR